MNKSATAQRFWNVPMPAYKSLKNLAGFCLFALLSTSLQALELTPKEAPNIMWGYVDAQGAWKIPPQFMLAGAFNAGQVAPVATQKGWYYINQQGEKLPFQVFIFDNGADEYREGLVRIRQAEHIGFADYQGKIRIAPQYIHAQPFSEGYAAVNLGGRIVRDGEHSAVIGGRWGYVNRLGQLAIPARYSEAHPFRNGVAEVYIGKQRQLIDHQGQRLDAQP